MSKQPLQSIYQHPLFSANDLEKIFDVHNRMTFPKGYFLLTQNDIAKEYYILEEGLVRAFVLDYDNNEITTEFFIENEIVIIPNSLFQNNPSIENLQAVTDLTVWKIEYADFQHLFHEIDGFREWGRIWFSNQLFAMKKRSVDMITESASTRYLKLLEEKPVIMKHAPLKQIASYLGITDTSLSRIRKEIIKKN